MKKVLILTGIIFSLNLMANSVTYKNTQKNGFNGKVARNLKKSKNEIPENKKEEILFQLGIPTAR